MRRATILVAVPLLLIAVSCHDSNPAPEIPAGPRTFLFAVRGLPDAEGQFVARTSDETVLAKVEAELRLPPADRTLHIHGAVSPAAEGENLSWHWRFVPDAWDLVEISAELCDGTPAMVEADVDKWVSNVGDFCPWSSYVVEEL